jgi:hypothetical protein
VIISSDIDEWFRFEAIAPIVTAKLKNQKEYSYQRHDERYPPPRTTKNKIRNRPSRCHGIGRGEFKKAHCEPPQASRTSVDGGGSRIV